MSHDCIEPIYMRKPLIKIMWTIVVLEKDELDGWVKAVDFVPGSAGK